MNLMVMLLLTEVRLLAPPDELRRIWEADMRARFWSVVTYRITIDGAGLSFSKERLYIVEPLDYEVEFVATHRIRVWVRGVLLYEHLGVLVDTVHDRGKYPRRVYGAEAGNPP